MVDKSTAVLVILGVLAASVMWSNGSLGFLGIPGPSSAGSTVVIPGSTTTTGTTTTTTPATEFCSDSSITMTVGPVQDKFTPTTSMSGLNHRVFVDDVDRGLFVDGGTLSVPFGKDHTVKVYYAANDTNLGFYGSEVVVDGVPCGAFATAALDTSKEESKLIDMTTTDPSLTVRLFSADNGDQITESNFQALTNNDVKDVKMTVDGISKAGISPGGKIYWILTGNQSNYDELTLKSIDGKTTVTKTNEAYPGNFTLPGTTDKAWMYTTPGCVNNCHMEFNIHIDVKNADPTSAQNISIFAFDEDWYRHTQGEVNSVTGNTMYFGHSDDAGVDVGRTSLVGFTEALGMGGAAGALLSLPPS